MRLQGHRKSDNVEDRRGRPVAPMAIGGGIGTIVLALIVMFLGGNPQQILQNQGGAVANQQAAGQPQELTPIERERGDRASKILAMSEDVWGAVFPVWNQRDPQIPAQYKPPRMQLFYQATRTGCGSATSASGPFYCPADEKIYLDTKFFDVMEKQLGASGDFAQAYVISHEVGHHIQKLSGATEIVNQARNQLPEAEANQYSVRLELQADFYAGVMFHHSQKMKAFLDRGDLEEGLGAAFAIGDDKLQKDAKGYAKQETFTHGTSRQRVKWFRLGLETGDPTKGNTFRIPYEQL